MNAPPAFERGEALRTDQPPAALIATAASSPVHGAARGAIEDQRALAAVSYASGEGRQGAGTIAALAEALSFARLAAIDGARKDLQVVVFLYGRIATECREAGDPAAGDAYEARGYLLAELMAQDGDEDMAAMVVNAGTAVTPAAHREARRLLDHPSPGWTGQPFGQ